MEEELRHDIAVIPYAPPPASPPRATPLPPESPNLPPPPGVKRAVRRLGIGDQQSAESSPQPALEHSPSPAPSDGWQEWPPKDNHYPTPPPVPRKDQTLLSSSESDAESCDSWKDQPPPIFKFRNGHAYVHKQYKGPKPLGFVDTRLLEGGRRDCFVAFTPRDLTCARRMDHVLRQHLVLN